MSHPRTLTLVGTEVARIGLGTNRLTTAPEHVAFIGDVIAAGFGHIDTAHLYTQGSSETAIGEAGAAATDGVVVATKGGFRAGEGSDEVLRAQIAESLRLLRTDHLDLYYLHRVDPETPFERSLATLAEHVERGVIRHVGLSEVSIDQIEAARRIVPVTAVQNEYNLEKRKWDDVVDYCEREGIVFVPFYPLTGDGPLVEEIANRHGATTSQVALAWLLRRSPAILPIPGTLSLDHARQNLAALDLELGDDDYEALTAS